MDSYFKTDFWTGFTGSFILPHFPEENEETQSDFVGYENIIEIGLFSSITTNILANNFDFSCLSLFIAAGDWNFQAFIRKA
jgi:hypothetical protein